MTEVTTIAEMSTQSTWEDGGVGEGGGWGGRVRKCRFHLIVNAQLFWW